MQDYLTAATTYVSDLQVISDSTSAIMYASDHAPFWARMIPALFLIENSDRFGGAFNPYYHQYSDTIGLGANSPWLAEKITRSAIATLLLITNPTTTILVPENFSDKTSISIYPNPASTTITVNGIKGDGHDTHLVIHDRTGKMLHHQNHLKNASVIDISHLPSGIYFMQFVSQDQCECNNNDDCGKNGRHQWISNQSSSASNQFERKARPMSTREAIPTSLPPVTTGRSRIRYFSMKDRATA